MRLINAYKTLEELCKNGKEKSLFECYQEVIGERTVSDKKTGRYRQRPYEQIVKNQQNQIDD